MRIDKQIFIGPFMINKISQLTISYEFISGSKGFNYYKDYFNELWNNPGLTADVV